MWALLSVAGLVALGSVAPAPRACTRDCMYVKTSWARFSSTYAGPGSGAESLGQGRGRGMGQGQRNILERQVVLLLCRTRAVPPKCKVQRATRSCFHGSQSHPPPPPPLPPSLRPSRRQQKSPFFTRNCRKRRYCRRYCRNRRYCHNCRRKRRRNCRNWFRDRRNRRNRRNRRRLKCRAPPLWRVPSRLRARAPAARRRANSWPPRPRASRCPRLAA